MSEKQEIEIRKELKPFVGRTMDFSGKVSGLSYSKGKYPKRSAIITDLQGLEEDIYVPHLWVLTKALEENVNYLFTATIVEYVTYDEKQMPLTRYGISNLKHLVKYDKDQEAAKKSFKVKREFSSKANEKNSSHALKIIQHMAETHGLNIVPEFVAADKWDAVVKKVESPEKSRVIASGSSFPEAVVNAKNIIEFLMEDS